jgi:hypothetical protein
MNASAPNSTGGLHLVKDGKVKGGRDQGGRDKDGRDNDGRPRRHRRWPWIVGLLLILWIGALLEVRHVMKNAEPILRARVIETLSARFKTKVELAELDASVANGLEISGKGLKIFGPTDANPTEPGVQPLIAVQEFSFRTGIFGLLKSPMHIDTVHVQGMILNIPPKEDRPQVKKMGGGPKQKIKINVGKFVCEDTELIINTRKPGKEPLDFKIGHLVMKEIGAGQPLDFDATLINPKPVGDIQSSGKFGPFREDQPGDTPVEGDYTFTHADLGTLKGIAGILSSTGNYRGILSRIEVQGKTDTPDFRVATGHPVALHTDFHAFVNGTDGDTYLEPVTAQFLHSSLTANGKVVRMKDPPGHDIELNVVLNHARVEDLLELGVKTDPPVLSGNIQMTTQMSLQPGAADVLNRLKLDGTFHIPDGEFSNKKIQDRIDSLSLRSQGKPKEVKEHTEDDIASDLDGTFRLDQGLLTFSKLNFSVPGTQADVTGQYSLDGSTFDFHGKLKLQAKLSQMTTGWKSALLKAVDPIFHKDGAGTEIPFKVTGTRSEPHFGLDLGKHDDEPKAGPAGSQSH